MRGLGIVLAMIAAAGAAFGEDACPPLRSLAVVDIAPGPRGGIAMPVTINDQPHTMLLDTGASITTITPRIVEELKLETLHSRSRVEDILGNWSDTKAVMPRFAVGRLLAQDVKVFVMPYAGGDEEGKKKSPLPGLAGLFGADFLRMYDVDIDFKAKKVRLVSQDHCPAAPYWHPAVFSEIPFTIDRQNHIIVWVTLDGADVKALVDTGASRTALKGQFADKAFDLKDESGSTHVINNERVHGLFRHRFGKLEMKGLAIENPVITVLPNVADTKRKSMEREFRSMLGGDAPNLVIGLDVLTKLHIYIAYKERKLLISAADDRGAP